MPYALRLNLAYLIYECARAARWTDIWEAHVKDLGIIFWPKMTHDKDQINKVSPARTGEIN